MTSLLELARRLRQERLFVRSEQEAIYQLNKQIRQRSEQLSHVFWTTRQHHLNLNHFITNSSHGTPANCSQRSSHLENVRFVDGYKELGYQESMYGNFLQTFRSNPTLTAACLAYGEKLSLDSTLQVVQTVVLGLYGNSIISGDHRHLLELMETLLLLQLANEDQPRRILHKGNAAFCIVYKLFTESLLSGKLFLTAALHKPIMQVLMDDELYLERDSNRILDCFSQVEIEKRFGKKDDPEFQSRVKKHLEGTEGHLFEICQSFIDSLHAAMYCFPQSMGWVIARAYHIVKEAGLVSHAEARALCADLMLQMFICPAIVNPELYGVSGDAPISDFTRFNLMQIAQVLQVLALRDEDAQPDNSLYGRFEKNCMSSLLDTVISTWHTDGLPMSSSSTSTPGHGFTDSAVFITCSQLAQLIKLLRDIQHADVRGVDQSSLAEVLSHLPENPPPALAQLLQRRESVPGVLLQNEHYSPDGENFLTHDQNHRGSTGSGSGSGGHPSPLPSRAGGFSVDGGSSPSTAPNSSKRIFSKSIKPKGKSGKTTDSHSKRSELNGSGNHATVLPKSGSGSGDSLSDDAKSQTANDGPSVVLVISLGSSMGSAPDQPGLLSENEVLELQACNEMQSAELNSESDVVAADAGNLNDAERMDKRLRFSLYSTDLSELGEGEAMSSTSGSSIEDMDPTESVQADDTSSFRGTSSHGIQDEDFEGEGDLESVPHTNNDEALKALERKLPTSRESIEDKMRKFEIRSQLGVRFGGAVVAALESDEAERTANLNSNSNYLDTRSETWSTDAYASDSETPTEQAESVSQSDRRLQEIAENPDQGPGQMRSSNAGPYLALLPRDEDSRSDVWSVEVLPSDSEPPDVKPEDRLQELESESTAGPEDQIDQLEDNRSRASTPGLSAASGVSGTSGLSLVSDNIQAKGWPQGGEEHGSSSERSFGKTPSSISPDADDMISSHRATNSGGNSSRVSAAGSSNSSGSGEGGAQGNRPQTAPTSFSMHNLLMESQVQSVSMGGQDMPDSAKNKNEGVNGLMKRSKSASPAYLGRVGGLGKKQPTSPVSMPSGANHLNWPEKPSRYNKHNENSKIDNDKYLDRNVLSDVASSPLTGTIPEAASTPDNSAAMTHDVVLESTDTNTIKRSPYKHNDAFSTDRASAFNSVPSSLARDISADAQNLETSSAGLKSHDLSYYNISDPTRLTKDSSETSAPYVNHAESNGTIPGSQANSTITMSTFVPITSTGTFSPSPPFPYADVSSFDPLASSRPTLSDNQASAAIKTKPVSTGNNLLNMNSMSAALVDLSMPGDQSAANRGVDQQSQIPSPVLTPGPGARPKNGPLTKHGSIDLDNLAGRGKKQPWWKSPKLPVLSTKRKAPKLPPLQSSKEESSVSGNGDATDGYLKTSSDIHLLNGSDQGADLPTPLEPKSTSSPSSNALDTLGEDIMEKYMRKAASNQSSPRPSRAGGSATDVPVPSGASALNRNSIAGSSPGHDHTKSSLDDTNDKTLDSQNPNSSSTTDPQSTPSNISSTASDRTVTTMTQGTSPNLSPPTPGKPAKAIPSTCPAMKNEYKPDPEQLIMDTQRKLRLMLATSESLPESTRFPGILSSIGIEALAGYHLSSRPIQQDEGDRSQGNRNNSRKEILSFLRLQLAEAVSLQDHSRIAQIHETTRCIHVLDSKGCKTLLQNLWREYKQRSAYVAYLVRTKQALLTTSSYLQHMFRCTERDQETCRRYLTSRFVSLFLKRMDTQLRVFRTRFTSATAADEKVALVREFLSFLYGEMSKDKVWAGASEEQLIEAERAIERSVFIYIYKIAIYPNGEGDVMRDEVYQGHISHLAAVVTPHHPALQIPKKYLNECPWMSAQAETKSINAYKTPRDKLAAVLRCCNTIMNLLKMADEGTVPGADDFTPVLVYVLIMANPPHLLSTVQYITSFIGDELTGEDSYWWMQFTAATEFIKTIDERK
uniref:GTPase-activating protein and VPS9 domain-containing protein 1-like isoform X1 n=1 Tax=Styela clava TaxID=7725 RepID=UPI001939A9E7|nr:GTPase-activating protein and VPS9 domain-containing protein 1-like isoform X1 [Styela clava]